MKRAKTLTKKERKALQGPGPSGSRSASAGHDHHIHCVSCGRHIDAEEFEASPPSAVVVTCQHGSNFASCSAHEAETRRRLDEHDRTGNPVEMAHAWH
jgi:hypothetical protein